MDKSSLLHDPRLLAAFYKRPELFQELRNANYYYHNRGGGGEADRFNVAFSELYEYLGDKLRAHIWALETAWDEIDE